MIKIKREPPWTLKKKGQISKFWWESVWSPASCEAETTIKTVNKDENGKRKMFLFPCCFKY